MEQTSARANELRSDQENNVEFCDQRKVSSQPIGRVSLAFGLSESARVALRRARGPLARLSATSAGPTPRGRPTGIQDASFEPRVESRLPFESGHQEAQVSRSIQAAGQQQVAAGGSLAGPTMGASVGAEEPNENGRAGASAQRAPQLEDTSSCSSSADCWAGVRRNSASNSSLGSKRLADASQRLNLILPKVAPVAQDCAPTLHTPNVLTGEQLALANLKRTPDERPSGTANQQQQQQLLIDSLAHQLASSANSCQAAEARVSLFTGLPSCTPASADRLAASTSVNPFFWGLASASDADQTTQHFRAQAHLQPIQPSQSSQPIQPIQQIQQIQPIQPPIQQHQSQQPNHLQHPNQHQQHSKLSLADIRAASALSPILLSPLSIFCLSPEQEAWLRLGLSSGQQNPLASSAQQPQELQQQNQQTGSDSRRQAQDLSGQQFPAAGAQFPLAPAMAPQYSGVVYTQLQQSHGHFQLQLEPQPRHQTKQPHFAHQAASQPHLEQLSRASQTISGQASGQPVIHFGRPHSSAAHAPAEQAAGAQVEPPPPSQHFGPQCPSGRPQVVVTGCQAHISAHFESGGAQSSLATPHQQVALSACSSAERRQSGAHCSNSASSSPKLDSSSQAAKQRPRGQLEDTKRPEVEQSAPVKKKSRGGRKKKLVTQEELAARKNRSKERNRVAAKRCRQKRKLFLDQLRDRIDELSQANQRLKRENLQLRSELASLKQQQIERP